ncbi:MAG: SelB C-terminal domain-containing protein [Anaerolineales bacterium]
MLNRAADANVVAIENDRVSIHGYKVELSKQQETAIDELLHVFEQNPYSTPSVKESSQLIGDDLYRYLIESGTLIQLSKDVVLRSTDFEAFVSEIKQFLEKGNSITVAQVRDKFQTSRKYALAIMEYMDSVGITMRKGDERILAS